MDQTEYLLGLWEDFERTQGTLESWNEFTRRAESCRLAAARRERKEEERRRREGEAMAGSGMMRVVMKESGEVMAQENDEATMQENDEATMQENHESMKGKEAMILTTRGHKEAITRKRGTGEAATAAKRARVAGESASQHKRSLREKKNDAATQRRTVFVTNVAFAATEKELREVFADCGEVVTVTVVRNNHGKSRGFAYVEFAKEEEAAAAVGKNGTKLQERKLEVKLSVPQEERKSEKKETPAAVAATIYVSGLAPGVSEYEFSVFFSKVRVGEGNEA